MLWGVQGSTQFGGLTRSKLVFTSIVRRTQQCITPQSPAPKMSHLSPSSLHNALTSIHALYTLSCNQNKVCTNTMLNCNLHHPLPPCNATSLGFHLHLTAHGPHAHAGRDTSKACLCQSSQAADVKQVGLLLLLSYTYSHTMPPLKWSPQCSSDVA